MNTNTSNSRFSQGLGSVRDPKLRYVLLPVFFMFMGFLLTRFVGFEILIKFSEFDFLFIYEPFDRFT